MERITFPAILFIKCIDKKFITDLTSQAIDGLNNLNLIKQLFLDLKQPNISVLQGSQIIS